MSDYVEEYRISTDDEKLEILRDLYKTCSEEEKTAVLEATQKVYNRIKGRD